MLSDSFKPFDKQFDETFGSRKKDADDFYSTVIPSKLNADETNVFTTGSGRNDVEQTILSL